MTSGSALRRLDFRTEPRDRETLDEVRRHLEDGGLLAYPTETVYGFGCALLGDALERLAALKNREPDHPFLLLVPDRRSVEGLRWTAEARELAEEFWPGALTLVLEDVGRRYPDAVRGPSGGVAVRQSPHPVARAVVQALGAPLTSTSANRPEEEAARTADQAERAAVLLGAGAETWVVDGGRLPSSRPSTIVDCTGPEPSVLREGAVPSRRLRCVGGEKP